MFGHGQSLNPASFKYNWKGKWHPDTLYAFRDVVRHRGRTYYCNTENLLRNNLRGWNEEPGKTGSAWTVHTLGQVNRGGWGPHKTYEVGDIVMYKGDWYLCKTAGQGIHPVYENGSLTNKWTRVIVSPSLNHNDRYVPLMGQDNPLGWTRYNGAGGTAGGSGSSGAPGVWLVDWGGNPVWYHNVHNYDGQYWKHLTVATDDRSSYGKRQGFQFIDRFMNDKQPITGEMECIQMMPGGAQSWFLFNNGEVYSIGYNNSGQLGCGHTSNMPATVQVGIDYGTSSTGAIWNGSITGKFREAFIVKIVGNNHGDKTASYNGQCIALDSEGYVWTWGAGDYGRTGLGYSANDLNADVTTPVKMPRSFFGGDTVVDLYSISAPSNGLYGGYFAITNNEIVYAWGYEGSGELGGGASRSMLRRPMPVFDGNKHGGIKRIQPMSNGTTGHNWTMILCNDGSVHFTGAADYIHPTYSDHGAYDAYRFIEMKQYLYQASRQAGSGALDSHYGDIWTNVDDLWRADVGYNAAASYGCGWLKDSDGQIRQFGYSSTSYTSMLMPEGDRTAGGLKHQTPTTITHPPIVDCGALNGRVDWLAPISMAYNGSARCGFLAASEEGQAKINWEDATANDDIGMGVASFNGVRKAQAMMQGDSQMYIDENAYSVYGSFTPRGGKLMNRVVQAGGATSGFTDLYGGVVTIDETGKAGITGGSRDTIVDYLEQRTNMGTDVQAVSRPRGGRTVFV